MIDIREHGGIFGGAGGSSIKSIQSGMANVPANSTKTVSVNDFDMSKSILFISVEGSSSADGGGYIANNNSIVLTNFIGSSTSTDVYWTLVEFENVKSLQRGTIVPTTDPQIVPINSVNLEKSLAVINYRNGASNRGGYRHTGYLTSPTELTLVLGTTATAPYIYWQVIEFK